VDPDVATELTGDRPEASESRTANVLTVFAVTWAMANLFHVWGPSARASDVFEHVTTAGVLHVAIGVTALVVLLRPRQLAPLVVLAALGPVSFWFEAPVVGSHWAVASFVDLAILLTVATTRDRIRVERQFIPVARWALIGFYSFAAFAKLNHAFFTPSVSCGTYYLDELAGSLGITVNSQTAGGWSHLVPFGVAGIELAIPILLLTRRTRNIGVVVALLFHGVIAFDQTHLFSDFSSVLVALFVLFLPVAFADDVVARFRALPTERRDLLRAIAVLGSGLLLAALWWQRTDAIHRIFVDGLGWAWVLYCVLGLYLVISFLWRERPAPLARPLAFDGVPRWMAIVPVLVIVNGLTPYTEVRTAYAFNMYSNLETVDGDSNHFLVTRTLPLTDFQSDLVRIVRSDDPGLNQYAVEKFDIVFLQLRDYLSRHPDVSVTYVRNGVEHSLAHAKDDPALVESVPSWESKFFAFRSVDQQDPNRCQPSFLSAL